MKKTLVIGVVLMLGMGMGVPVVAEEAASIRPDIDTPTLRKQLNAKRLYREAWDMDNGVQLSTIDQLEYIQANNPGLDEDTMAIVKQGTDLMKKMKFGLKDADIAQDSAAIHQDPTQVITKISDSTLTEATSKDAMSAIDLMDPSKRLMEKVLTDKNLGRKGYQINIDSF